MNLKRGAARCRVFILRLRVRRDGDDRDQIFARAVVPENAVCTGRIVLGVGFKYIVAIYIATCRKFMSIQTGMAGIVFEFA